MSKQAVAQNTKIAKIETTNDKISSRGGLAFFLRYVEKTKFYALIEHRLGFLTKSRKGLSFYQLVKQLLAFFIDGSDMSMQSFDRRKQDQGYIAILENTEAEMASSHQIKRFFRKFIGNKQHLCRFILHELFIWRLKIEKPEIITLFPIPWCSTMTALKNAKALSSPIKRKKDFSHFISPGALSRRCHFP